MNNINTSINICDVNFKNPVIAASGTFGFGMEYNELYDVGILGGICTKGLTINPKEGNKGIRLWETRGGLINSIGLENPGISFFVKYYIKEMRKFDTNIIVNLGGNTIEDYVQGAEILSANDIDMIELNISCPNVKHGGMAFGIKSKTAYEIVKEVKKVCKKPLIVKLSPNAENIVEMAIQCEKAGADAISLVNTFKAMAIDVRKRKAIFNNITAGLSGACIKPIALRMVYEVCKNVSIPVIGIGGIEKGEDAIEFIMAGAKAVEVGTANFVNPLACKNIIKEIEEFMINENIKNIEEIRGII